MPNRLISEASPYLLQHAHNPVDWYPWGPEALERARAEDRPILLSIGYAACHWCHVMERESFEDPEVAALMNEEFVCVKVDREERPDLDAVYMDAVQAMTGSGGWPMTVFLTPEGQPFFAGTYFPPQERHGMPAFRRVLTALAQAWRERRADVDEQGLQVARAIGRASSLTASADPLSEDVLRQAHGALRASFDRTWGGFGGAPKFPQPMTLEFLLRCHLRGYEESFEMVERTLDRMAGGGVYDQVGGGFHRYSVDARWHVPHFEKMLYDNAQLARLYLRAWQVGGRERYRTVARETLDYLLREMRHPDGGFWSSQDADSEGVEGRFFAWSYGELVEAATQAGASAGTAEAVAAWYGAVPEGNWEDGSNVLWTPFEVEAAAAEAGLDPQELLAAAAATRRRLFERREGRVRPATDDKVLAAWNGLAIAAFAEAGRALGEPAYVRAAEEAARFVLARCRRQDGRLLRAWRDGRTSGPGYLDDHAAMAEACLTLYETTFDPAWFVEARSLADAMLELFGDPDGGGFFQTGSDAEELVVRPKEVFDNAVPSGGSTAALVLQRLALLTGEAEYERAGLSVLRLVHDLMRRAPAGFGAALSALDLYLSRAKEVAVIGDPAGAGTRALTGVLHERFLPNAVLAAGAPGAAEPALLRDRPAVDGRATAYVCEGFVCRRPVTEPGELVAQLSS
jgi:uncharacterized protein